MKRNLELALGIQWSDTELKNTIAKTELILERLDKSPYKRDLPVHWLIPSLPFFETDEQELNNLILEIKTRIKSLADVPVATGYSGSIFPLLSFSELQKELAWSISNPWKSGIRDIFNETPQVLMPRVIDFSRNNLAEIYTDYGFKYLGINRSFPFPLQGNIKTITRFQYLDATKHSTLSELKKQVNYFLSYKYQYLFFLLDLTPQLEVTNLEAIWTNFAKIVEWLARKTHLAFAAVNRSKIIEKLAVIPMPEERYIAANTPGLRQSLAAGDSLRKKAVKEDADYKQILSTMAGPAYRQRDNQAAEQTSPASFPPPDRIHDCTMQGNTILAGHNFSAIFQNGKLHNLVDSRQRNLLCGNPANSFIRIQKKTYPFQNISAASIGGEHTRGLREIQKIVLPGMLKEGSQLTDYIFIDDFPYLISSTRLQYPCLDPHTIIEAIAPFEIPLVLLDKTATVAIQTLSPDSKQVYTLDRNSGICAIPGSLFTFPVSGTNLIIGFPPQKNYYHGMAEFSVEPAAKKFLLKLNLFGTYTAVQASAYNKVTEIFSFYIGVSQLAPESIPYFPLKLLQEIPQQTIIPDFPEG